MIRNRSPLTLLAAAALAAGCGAGDKDAATMTEPTAAAAEPTRYDAEAFFTTTSYSLAGGYAWSPDDAALLISSDETGIFNVYALSVEDGSKTPLTRSTTDSTYAVSWFPEDARVLYTADQGGNELDHLYVREESGEAHDLTPGDEVKAQFGGWSGDGRYFYAMTNERDPATYLQGMREAVDAIVSGRLDPTPLYTHRLALDDLAHAFELARRRPAGFMKALVSV